MKYEQDPNIRKRSVKAVELFSLLMQERASTGRIYIQTWITVILTHRLIRLLHQCVNLTYV